MTTLVLGFVGYVITLLFAVIMKFVREAMKEQDQEGEKRNIIE